MGKLLDVFKKGLSYGTIESKNDKKKPTISKITNKLLLQELVTHFVQSMDELSVGQRLLYPMSFNILMHPDDYNETKESLPFVLPEVVSAFYAAIKREKEKYSDTVNATPPASYWFFQFSACRFGEKDGQESPLERGRIITLGSLTTFEIQNVRSEANVRLSVKCQNSNVNETNINMEALRGVDILGEGTFRFNFDKKMNEDSRNITAVGQESGWATLRWSEGAVNKTYIMYDTYIEISGSAETRKGRHICPINSDAVSAGHVHIRYDQQSQTFQLAAWAKIRLNQREVPLSDDNTIRWVSLPRFKSNLFLNDAVHIDFNANPDML